MWLLRQPIEGDRFITVSNVSDTIGECWIDSFGDYVPNTIAIRIENIEYILPTVHDLQLGFLTIKIPSTVQVKENTSIQVYSKCSDNPEYITLVQNAKPVQFILTMDTPSVCKNEVNVSSTLLEWVRLYIPPDAGDFFLFNAFSIDLPNPSTTGDGFFTYQPGNSGNVQILPSNTSGFGLFNRPATWTEPAYLFSTVPIGYNNSLVSIKIISDRYYTLRVGYIEVIFKGFDIYYVNYLSDNFEEHFLTKGKINDIISINFGLYGYGLSKNSLPIVNIQKRILYTVSAGTIVPAIAPLATISVWTLPSIKGTYSITANLGQTSKFITNVEVHSCGTAEDDNYVGVVNESFSSNVSLNDIPCEGEINEIRESLYGKVGLANLILNKDGTFTATPITDFIGNAQFIYERWCGNTIEELELVASALVTINFSDECTTTDPIWEDTGRLDCIECTAQKEQRNINEECSGIFPNRWIPITDQSICSHIANWVDTNETVCEGTHSYMRQVNLNHCSDDDLERWIDLGIHPDCDCLGEVFITTCCGDGPYYPIIKLLDHPEEENRAIHTCLIPDLGETCLNEKVLRFNTLNDGLKHTYIISLFDCYQKLINQVIFRDFNCAGNSDDGFNYVFNFIFQQ